MNMPILARNEGLVKVSQRNESKISQFKKPDFNSMGHDEAVRHLIHKLQAKQHRQFAEFRTVGEWFDDSKGLIAAFAAKQGVAA